jgi:hypothetical protein
LRLLGNQRVTPARLRFNLEGKRVKRSLIILAALATIAVALLLPAVARADDPAPDGWTWDGAVALAPDGWTWNGEAALEPDGWSWDGTAAPDATEAAPAPDGWTWNGEAAFAPDGWTWDRLEAAAPAE